MQRWLNEWIMNYVDADPVNSSQETKARRPLAAAEVVVEEVEGNPVITTRNSSCVRISSEGLTGSLRTVTKLPSVKQGNA